MPPQTQHGQRKTSTGKRETEAAPLIGQASAGDLEPPRLGMILSFAMLGTTSFILSNGFWAELPILVRTQPEGFTIAAYIIVCLQLANIVPAAYVWMRRNGVRDEGLITVIYALLICGLVVSLLIAFLYPHTTRVAGRERSVALLCFAFISACISNTTNVVYYPFVGRYSHYFTSALSTGGGCSGLVAGVVGMLQNSGSTHPRFTMASYFIFVACVFMGGIVALTYIVMCGDDFLTINAHHEVHEDHKEGSPDKQRGLVTLEDVERGRARKRRRAPELYWYSRKIVVFLLQQALFGSLAYGLIPSICPIMVSGYATPLKALMWSNVLGMITDPIGRALTAFRQIYAYWLLTPLASGLAAILIACAAMAPTPPLHQYTDGFAMPVVAYAFFQLLTGFTLTELFYSIRIVTGDARAEMAYRWGGLSIQLGALLGTSLGFYLVIIAKVITP